MKLSVNGLYKSFGEKAVLSGVNFEAESGKALGLLGRNGAGKTTTIRIIMKVFTQDSGQVLIDGEPLNTDKVKIGYLPEERGLYPKRKVLPQLIYFGCLQSLSKREAEKNALVLLERLGMTEYRDKKLDTLSKGNQQKIQLISTLIASPDIIILDEPFSGLDPVNARLLKELIEEQIANGKIVLFSSHQMNYIEEFCNDIAILNAGKIVLDGSISSIKRSFKRNSIVVESENPEKVSAVVDGKIPSLIESREVDSGRLTFTLKSEDGKAELFKALESESDIIDAFYVKEPTLNEIFVKYTEASV